MGHPRRDHVEAGPNGGSPAEALLRGLAESARTGTQAALQGRPDAARWHELEREVSACVVHRIRSFPTERLDAETLALIRRTEALLRRAVGEAAAQTYAGGIRQLGDAREAALVQFAPITVAARMHEAVAWFGVWHLVATGAPIATAIGIVNGKYRAPEPAAGSPGRPVPPPPPRPVRTIDANRPPLAARAKTTAARATVALRPRLDRFITMAGAFYARSAAHVIRGRKDVAAILRQRAKARGERAAQAAVARRAATARDPEAATAFSLPDTTDRVIASGTSTVDGNRMRSPLFGTWLMLVVLSWVALVWGVLLTIPFVGPFGVIGAMMGGFVAVPLWGTVWGFLGMGAAHDSTLRDMDYADADPLTPLAQTAAQLASRLDLPPPRIGTIAAFNAFAMGTDHRHATVAIGRPLMLDLTPDELAAVIGHELGHVVSGDMRKMMLMRTFQNATVWFAMFQGLKQFARWVISWAAELAILAFSRRREYWADAIGAAITSKEAMIGALRKLDQAPALTPGERTHARFMFRGSAFSTHPSIEQRIAALEKESYLNRLPYKR